MKAWARYSELKPGDWLIADGGFTCLYEGEKMLVYQDENGAGLYVACRPPMDFDEDAPQPPSKEQVANRNFERHYLDGQLLDDGDTLIGLVKA